MGLEKIAEVLDRLADYIDAEETAKSDILTRSKVAEAEAVVEKIAAVTGEEVPAELASKLAQSDPETLGLLERLTARSDSFDLGGPVDRSDARTKKATAMSAENEFADWAVGP
jgi:hypothetical protein